VKRIRNFHFAARVFSSTSLEGENSMSMKLMITTAAIVAALAAPAFAGSTGHTGAKAKALRYVQQTPARASVESVFDADARASYNSPPAFAGYPTDYLMNRFADRQLQGR
jgi:hypothetical protein